MDIAEIKSAHRVEDVIGKRVNIRRKGSLYVGRCPFHDDRGRPNLIVFPKTQTWSCFACGVQGDVLDFVRRIDNITLHEAMIQLGSSPRLSPKVHPEKQGQRTQTARPETRDRVFRTLIAHEALSEKHRLHLKARGFSASSIERNGYRTHKPGLAPIALQGCEGVPGFFYEKYRWRVAGPQGLLIPIRNVNGLIIGCQIRADNPNSNKYRWLSSVNRPNGTSSRAPAHVAAGQRNRVWITEGPLKADFIAQCLGETAIGIAGVSTWKRALPIVVNGIKPKEVVIAFDQDDRPETRQAVNQIAKELAGALRAKRHSVTYASWKEAKGIDDALVGGFEVLFA